MSATHEDTEQEVVYVYVDEDGNEIEVSDNDLEDYEVVEEYEEEYEQDEEELEEGEERGGDSSAKSAGEDNPLSYDNVQETTDNLNDIAREGVAAARELKETYDDIKGLFSIGNWLK